MLQVVGVTEAMARPIFRGSMSQFLTEREKENPEPLRGIGPPDEQLKYDNNPDVHVLPRLIVTR